MFLKNTPTIIIFWFLMAAIFVFMIVSAIAAIAIHKKGNKQNPKKTQFIEKLCLIVSIICSIPIFLVVGYVLYIHMG